MASSHLVIWTCVFSEEEIGYNIAVSEHHLEQKKILSLIYISFSREVSTIINVFLKIRKLASVSIFFFIFWLKIGFKLFIRNVIIYQT